jgi:hypothetical protein
VPGAGEGSVFARSYRLKSPFLTCGCRWQFRKSASFAGLLTMPPHVRHAGIPGHGRGDVANSPWVCSATEVYFRKSQVSRTNVPPTIPSAFGDNGPPTFGRSECRGETYIVTVRRGGSPRSRGTRMLLCSRPVSRRRRVPSFAGQKGTEKDAGQEKMYGGMDVWMGETD